MKERLIEGNKPKSQKKGYPKLVLYILASGCLASLKTRILFLVFWKRSPRFLVMKENKPQTKQDFIKPINNSMQMDLKSKQIFRVWSMAGFG